MYETSPQGFDIFSESVIRTTENLGDKFDYHVLYNGKDNGVYQYLFKILQRTPHKIKLHPQKESDLIVKGVSMWKAAPPRLDINTHEIICDNDLIITKPFPKIDQFLSSNRTMILFDPIRYYGKFDHLHPRNERYNSGFIGLPPGYDYGKIIREVLAREGKFSELGYDDEQGLLTYCLKPGNPIGVTLGEIVELAKSGAVRMCHKTIDYTGDEQYGYHFVESNRHDDHSEWRKYKQKLLNSVLYT